MLIVFVNHVMHRIANIDVNFFGISYTLILSGLHFKQVGFTLEIWTPIGMRPNGPCFLVFFPQLQKKANTQACNAQKNPCPRPSPSPSIEDSGFKWNHITHLTALSPVPRATHKKVFLRKTTWAWA